MRFPTFRTITTHLNLFLIPALITLISVCAQFSPLAEYFIWDRHAIAQGQWWRILSGNLTHTNLNHLGMNLAALWLIHLIFRPPVRLSLQVFITTGLFIGVSLFWTEINRYVGLSGILHGLFAAYALLEALHGRRSSWLLFAGVAGKVLWEQCFGAPAATVALIQAPVAIQAHLAGLCSGSVLAFILRYSERKSAGKTG